MTGKDNARKYNIKFNEIRQKEKSKTKYMTIRKNYKRRWNKIKNKLKEDER